VTDLNPKKLQELLDGVRRQALLRIGEGRVADYIPELAKVDLKKLGIAVATVEGDLVKGGDAEEPLSIQSISKVFTLTLALGKIGDALWQRVGREPSGTSFDSIVQLEHERGLPRNPFINAGAIVVADVVLAGHQPREAIGHILQFVRFVADDETVAIDPAVARSETECGYRNRALANYMRAFDNLIHPVDMVLGVYFHHCAISMNCCQLARAGLFLANGGRIPRSNASVVSPTRARRICSPAVTTMPQAISPFGSACRARAVSEAAFLRSFPDLGQ